jgi:hypothetical protein
VKKTVNILIIILVLASAARITIDRHYCRGKVVDVRLDPVKRHASCGMKSGEAKCSNASPVLTRTRCCHNETVTYSVDNYLVTSNFEVKKPFMYFIDIMFVTPVNYLINSKNHLLTMAGTGPPGSGITPPDQQSRLRVFRI